MDSDDVTTDNAKDDFDMSIDELGSSDIVWQNTQTSSSDILRIIEGKEKATSRDHQFDFAAGSSNGKSSFEDKSASLPEFRSIAFGSPSDSQPPSSGSTMEWTQTTSKISSSRLKAPSLPSRPTRSVANPMPSQAELRKMRPSQRRSLLQASSDHEMISNSEESTSEPIKNLQGFQKMIETVGKEWGSQPTRKQPSNSQKTRRSGAMAASKLAKPPGKSIKTSLDVKQKADDHVEIPPLILTRATAVTSPDATKGSGGRRSSGGSGGLMLPPAIPAHRLNGPKSEKAAYSGNMGEASHSTRFTETFASLNSPRPKWKGKDIEFVDVDGVMRVDPVITEDDIDPTTDRYFASPSPPQFISSRGARNVNRKHTPPPLESSSTMRSTHFNGRLFDKSKYSSTLAEDSLVFSKSGSIGIPPNSSTPPRLNRNSPSRDPSKPKPDNDETTQTSSSPSKSADSSFSFDELDMDELNLVMSQCGA